MLIRLLEWALWSRTRALTAVAVLVAALVAAGFGAHQLGQDDDQARPASAAATARAAQPSASDTPSTDAERATDPEEHAHDETTDPAQIAREVEARAEAFMRAWLDVPPARKNGSEDARVDTWLARVTPHVAPTMHSTLATTNLDAIPTTKIRTVTPFGGDTYNAHARVDLANGDALDLWLGWDGDEWLVSMFAPAVKS